MSFELYLWISNSNNRRLRNIIAFDRYIAQGKNSSVLSSHVIAVFGNLQQFESKWMSDHKIINESQVRDFFFL